MTMRAAAVGIGWGVAGFATGAMLGIAADRAFAGIPSDGRVFDAGGLTSRELLFTPVPVAFGVISGACIGEAFLPRTAAFASGGVRLATGICFGVGGWLGNYLSEAART